jgi:hypothetical protein
MSEPIIMCGPKSYYLDDIKDNCEKCGCEIFYRPHTPKGINLCTPCALKFVAEDPSTVRFCITEETLIEAIQEIKMRQTKN